MNGELCATIREKIDPALQAVPKQMLNSSLCERGYRGQRRRHKRLTPRRRRLTPHTPQPFVGASIYARGKKEDGKRFTATPCV